MKLKMRTSNRFSSFKGQHNQIKSQIYPSLLNKNTALCTLFPWEKDKNMNEVHISDAFPVLQEAITGGNVKKKTHNNTQHWQLMKDLCKITVFRKKFERPVLFTRIPKSHHVPQNLLSSKDDYKPRMVFQFSV